jgi:hypothetical protein
MLHFSSLISKRNNSCLPLQNQMEVNTLSSSFPNTVIVGKQVPASPSLRGTLLARICNPCLSLRLPLPSLRAFLPSLRGTKQSHSTQRLPRREYLLAMTLAAVPSLRGTSPSLRAQRGNLFVPCNDGLSLPSVRYLDVVKLNF